MKKEHLINFYNQLIGFNTRDLILVIYDDLSNSFTYIQGSKQITASWINYMYFPVKYRYGILTPEDYMSLMENINSLVNSKYIEDTTLMTSMDKGRVSFYYMPITVNGFNPSPVKILDLKFISFNNPLVVRFLLLTYDVNSRVLLKRIKFDKKLMKTKSVDQILEDNPKDNTNLNNR